MPTQPVGSSRPERHDLGWRVALSGLGCVSLVSAAVASLFIFGWLAFLSTTPSPFPAPALIGFVPALVSIALGAWTWHTDRVRRMGSIVAIAGGAFGLLFAGGYLLMGLLFFQS